MANYPARACIPKIADLVTEATKGRFTASVVHDLKAQFDLTRPSKGSIDTACTFRKLIKLSTAEDIFEIINKARNNNGMDYIEADGHIVKFDHVIPNLGQYITSLENSGHSREDISIQAGYPLEVIVAAFKKRSLPQVVCNAISTAVAQTIGVSPIPCIAVPEGYNGSVPPSMDGGARAIIESYWEASVPKK